MARIVLGIATSHGPMLSVPPEAWPERVAADRSNPEHFFRGLKYTFEEIVALRRPEKLNEQITAEVFRQRHGRCQQAIRRLGDIYCQNPIDAAIVVGNDQMEVFSSGHVPAFAIFWGSYVEGIPRTPEFLAKLPPGIARAEADRTPEVYTRYPCQPDLGRHLIETATANGFDVAQLTELPVGAIGLNAVPHAWGFVYRRIMRDAVVAHVPVFVNTFYPPNQPTARRCIQLGRCLAKAVSTWDADRTIAVFASGGLSHFVIDETFDRDVLAAMRARDFAALSQIPEEMLQAGTSEIKNWLVAAGMLMETSLAMEVVDYVPCYRSEAGTGSAMGFAAWR